MTTRVITQSKEYAQAAASIIATLPPERAAQVYDFARFLQSLQSSPARALEDTDDWLLDSEEQMQAEDALWDAAYARHKAEFLTLREAARTEINTGVSCAVHHLNG